MAKVKQGSSYRFAAQRGLAAMHVEQLPAEMAELDLAPDTVVTVEGSDDERGLVLVSWSDRHGNPRVTSVEPDVFAEHFVGV